MDILDFNKLKDHRTAITDLTTLKMLYQHANLIFESPITSQTEVDNYYLYCSSNKNFRHVLNILERLVVYDFLVFDKASMPNTKSYELYKAKLPEDLIKEVVVPSEIYQKTIKQLSENIYTNTNYLLENTKQSDAIGNKVLFDGLSKLNPYWFKDYISGSLLQSARALFYMTISSNANIPFFLNPAKDKFIELYHKKTIDALKSIEDFIDEKFKVTINNLLNESYNAIIPSLAEYLLRSALKKKTSLLNIVREVKNKKEAKEFQKWLLEIQRLVSKYDRASLADASKKMKEFKSAITKWSNSLDINDLKYYSKTGVEIGLPPSILGIKLNIYDNNIEINPPVITKKFQIPNLFNRPLYLSFISSWFQK